MGRPKGGTNRKYSIEDKMKVIRRYIDDHISLKELGKEFGISPRLILTWVERYGQSGVKGLESRRKGNPYAALHVSKSLNELERVKLENLKLRVENERLKKGYIVKGVGTKKVYVTLNDKTIK